MNLIYKDMRKIERIFIHCTASAQTVSADGILAEFRAKGWRYPGYHYLVMPDGSVVPLLDERLVSNGVRGYNSTSVNIAYIGGVKTIGGKLVPVDNRTPEQKASLIRLLKSLRLKYPSARIMGHRSIWGENSPGKWKKSCPCFNALEEYKDI